VRVGWPGSGLPPNRVHVTKERAQRELKEEASKLFLGGVREVAVLEYGDDPMVDRAR
jgi:hypothetical protein